MLFNSLAFLVFFPLVCFGYYLLPHRWRWLFLLLASCLFYMAFIPAYILILFLTIIVDYVAALRIETTHDRIKKCWLIGSLVSTGLILAIFKYFNFLNGSAAVVASWLGLNYSIKMLNVLLPIGLSFHTFQSMSYVIEVYRGKQKAERHFGIYALYVMFFPQLVAGPIERPQNLLWQFREKHVFDPVRVTHGLKTMAWGFFHKVVIADRLAMAVQHAYAQPAQASGLTLVLATFFFSVQIFCDFAGYSLIALGAAEVLGFNLMQNFKRPYFATSIADFWRRWHISLSTWFRDYVYIPLGGNRVGRWLQYRNILIVFLISGLWHGANWTYVVWGALHGLFSLSSHLTTGLRARLLKISGLGRLPRLHHVMTHVFTLTLVGIAWVFFRAASVSEAFYILNRMTQVWREIVQPSQIIEAVKGLGLMRKELAYAAGSIGLLLLIHAFEERGTSVVDMISRKPILYRWTAYLGLLTLLVYFGAYDSPQQFIYFQF